MKLKTNQSLRTHGILMASLLALPAANAATIAEYTFDSDDLVATSVASGMTADDLATPNAANTFAFNDNDGGRRLDVGNPDYQETDTAAITDGQYITFGVQATGSNTLNIDFISFDHSRTSSAPRATALYASFNGGSFSKIGSNANNSNSSNLTTYNRPLGTDFDSVTSADFRLVFFDDNTNPGIARYDNIIVDGAVVPEPTSALLATLGGLLCMTRRRRA